MTYLDKSDFPFADELESQWQVVLEELNAIPREEFTTCFIDEGYSEGWVVFPLINRLPHADKGATDLRERCEANAKRCPKTVALLDKIEGLTGACFSMMRPGCHIYPHSDFDTPKVYRCHLGLHTDPFAKFRVADQIRSWEAGKLMCFDGKSEHEAGNTGPEPRVILLFDVLQEHYPAVKAAAPS